jgi:zinc/manganese transport system substrate-binding protein
MQRFAIFLTAIVTLFGFQSARADEKLDVVATFSILGDFVKNVGGDRVFVSTLVDPNGDTHVYTPSPTDAKKLADANVIFVNGLGLEGWLDRLIPASGTKATIIVATKGIKPRESWKGE